MIQTFCVAQYKGCNFEIGRVDYYEESYRITIDTYLIMYVFETIVFERCHYLAAQHRMLFSNFTVVNNHEVTSATWLLKWRKWK